VSEKASLTWVTTITMVPFLQWCW